MDKEVAFEEWQMTVPAKLRSDPLWQSAYYRMAMYLFDLVWFDCTALRRDDRGRAVIGQLVRSSGSICANVEEAYGRGVGTPDYVRILRIALGEARETQGWYFRARNILPAELLERRICIITQVIAMLASTLASHRKKISNKST